MNRFVVLAAAAAMFAGAGSLSAQCDKAHCSGEEKAACCSKKATISKLKTISKGDLVSMIQAKQVVVVDARDEESFAGGHIDGALNVSKASLPDDKNATLVFYCGGLQCPLAGKAAKMAMEQGYKNVLVYKGGWAEWSNS